MIKIINLICYFISLIYLAISRITGFYNMSVHLSKISFAYGNKIRYFFYKKTLNSVGDNVLFPHNTIFSNANISIGNNVRFGPYNTIGLADFGDDILIAQNVHFLSGKNQHSYSRVDIPINKQGGKIEKIEIENDCWIGAGSIIMSNVNKGSVVASGSIVTKVFDKYLIIGGNPAKVIKKR
jgi:virginiamycin A acetyltransferase